MCGYVLEDKSHRGGPSFKELFAKYSIQRESKLLFDTVQDDPAADLLGLTEPTEPKPEVDDESF
jgi:hypothetical protein